MKSKNILKIIILALVFIVLINPQWIPFMPAGVQNAVSAEMQKTFGSIAGGNAGIFNPAKLITAAAAVLAVWIVTTVVCTVTEKVCANKKRSMTVAGLIISVIKVVSVIAGSVWVLGIMGVNLAGIFASLGIVSLIIGFGAQSLIEDSITGIFIIFEGHYNIGDIIILDDFRGTVKKISMRTTTIEDAGGNLKIVNNSDIRNIQNRSVNISATTCDIGISYNQSIAEVEKVIAENIEIMYERNKDVWVSAPVYLGVNALADSAVVIRMLVNATETNIFAAQRRLNREMKILFDENNIEIPFAQIVVHNEK